MYRLDLANFFQLCPNDLSPKLILIRFEITGMFLILIRFEALLSCIFLKNAFGLGISSLFA